MAISTIGSDGLATGAVTSTKLTSGVPTRSQLPAGTVLQVVTGTLTSNVTTSSATPVSSGLTASITPTSSTSKILVLVSGGWFDNLGTTGQQLLATIYRNTTNLGGSNGLSLAFSPLARIQAPACVGIYDSPATTSSTSYTLYFASSNTAGNVQIGASSAIMTITLMEIAA